MRVLAPAAAGAGSRDVALESAVPTGGSQISGGTLSAPLVHVGAVTDPLPHDVDVNGKIAVQQLGTVSHRRRQTRHGTVRVQPEPAFSTSVAGDLGGYAPLNVPRVQAIHSGPMYHTSGDVLESISRPGLERAARFYAFFVSAVAKAPRSAIDPGRF